MPEISRKLIRKRSEHNEGIISTLEEISLHQEEIESINEVLGMTCRKLKILYLQNNIIPKMENLHHLKDLEYLNLALNNITKIEGLSNCEFLKKLDLTVNFIDLDTLEESIDNLVSRHNLHDLYLMGNPAQANWDQFNMYVIARLPQLVNLDGTEITKSLQIRANQMLPKLQVELRSLAAECLRKKAAKQLANQNSPPPSKPQSTNGDEADETADEMTENTPEARIKIYQELAQQKKEKEDREKVNAPKERDYEREHAEAVDSVRAKESGIDEQEIKQKNEGGWEFLWDEDSKPGHIVLEVKLSKFLDSSLVDVDVHPTYVSVVIKGKVLRLRLPAEVRVADSKCQRSKASGSLSVIMPKVNPKEHHLTVKRDTKSRQASNNSNSRVKYNGTAKEPSLQELMMQEALSAASLEPKESKSTSLSTQDLATIVERKLPADSSLDEPSKKAPLVVEL